MKIKKIKINLKKVLFCVLIIGLFVLAINCFNLLIKTKEGISCRNGTCGRKDWSCFNNGYCYAVLNSAQNNANRVINADKKYYEIKNEIDSIRKQTSDINNKSYNHGNTVNNLNATINDLNKKIYDAKSGIAKSS